ncbi:hypothetical protein [Aeromonas hydrophila]|uniref:hypothetical protein n=1 Tax=Aeromonas hydrophila TaxID=644 RepID=UPI00137756FB|nr:hypothetical protein [Aeromonas hydrophila]
MQFQTIPGQPDIVMWMTQHGSGIAREGDPEWDVYQTLLASGKTPDPLPQPTLAQEQAEKLVHDEAERMLAAYRSSYSSIEVESWPQQATEASAWLMDETAPTPLLLAIIQPDEDLRELCNKVLANATAYQQTVADVIQWRRSASQTIADLFASGPVTHLIVHYPEVPHAS